MKRLFSVLLVCVTICGIITGCNVAGNQENLPTPYPVRVASVTVEKAPEKVVCLSPSLTELTYGLGYGGRLVGRTTDATYPEAASALPTVGKTGKIDTAALLALEPDTVVSHSSLSKKEMTALEAARVKVVVLPMAKDLEELKTLYQQLALLYAGQLDAEAIAAKYNQKLTDSLKEIKATLPEADFENGFAYIINPSSGITATGDTLESSVLSAVFGANAAAEETGYKIEAATLAEKNPSVIFTADPYGLPHLEASKSYQGLNAVKNKKVITVKGELFATQSIRMADAVKVAAKTLYPELFVEEETSSLAEESSLNSEI